MKQNRVRRSRALMVSMAALLSGLAAGVQANPQGSGTVAAGSATITSAGKTLTVNQSSNRAIVNWQGFSVGAGETTRMNFRPRSRRSSIASPATPRRPSPAASLERPSLSDQSERHRGRPTGRV